MKKMMLILAALICIGLAAQTAYCADVKAQTQPETSSKVVPKKVQVDSNFDGKVDRIETYDDEGIPVEIEVDNDFDGIMDETVIYEGGKPVKSEKDTNKDGKVDVWVDL